MALPPLPALTGGKGGDAAPSWANSSSMFDSSGWNVNFGSGSVTSSDKIGQYLPYVLAAAGVLVVWRMTRRKR